MEKKSLTHSKIIPHQMTKRFHIHKFVPFGGLFAITEEMASGRCDSGNDLENDHFLLHLEAN